MPEGSQNSIFAASKTKFEISSSKPDQGFISDQLGDSRFSLEDLPVNQEAAPFYSAQEQADLNSMVKKSFLEEVTYPVSLTHPGSLSYNLDHYDIKPKTKAKAGTYCREKTPGSGSRKVTQLLDPKQLYKDISNLNENGSFQSDFYEKSQANEGFKELSIAPE